MTVVCRVGRKLWFAWFLGRGLSVVYEGWFDVLGFFLLTPFTVAHDVKLFACVATQEFPSFLPVVTSVRTWNVVGGGSTGASCLLWKATKIIDSKVQQHLLFLLCCVPSHQPSLCPGFSFSGQHPGLLPLSCPAPVLLSCSDSEPLLRQLAEVWDVWEAAAPRAALGHWGFGVDTSLSQNSYSEESFWEAFYLAL